MKPKCACGKALQLHLDFPRFYEYLQTRMRIFRGDLTVDEFRAGPGRLRPADPHHRFGDSLRGVVESQIGEELPEREPARNAGSGAVGAAGASLSWPAAIQPCEHGGGGGKRQNEVVTEDKSIDWERSDYDPYARTKKFCEHMIRQLLAGSADHDFPPEHCAGRQPARRRLRSSTWCRSFVFLAGLAGAAVPAQ